ncbi:MAG TPA: DUF5655 domain-containing protein [Allosphingosinicella sp.]|jgi:hypothetical protein|nr:DUF5655 domain-containing protein [Allosphingosinicella sp.]
MARPDGTQIAAGNSGEAVNRIFARSEPEVRTLARALIERARALPDVTVDPKGTCIHLNRRTAFAGLHPRKYALLLNLRSSAPIEGARIRKVEKVSANRYHNEMLVESAEALDDELIGWIADAHALAG